MLLTLLEYIVHVVTGTNSVKNNIGIINNKVTLFIIAILFVSILNINIETSLLLLVTISVNMCSDRESLILLEFSYYKKPREALLESMNIGVE